MRTLAPGNNRGFTLVEVLIVLTLMAIALRLVVVRLDPDAPSILREEAGRLSEVLDGAYQEAVSTGHQLGMTVTASGWRFWRLSPDGQWQPLVSDHLADGQLLHGARIRQVVVGGKPLAADQRLQFAPGGINAPFSVWLVLDQATLRIDGNGIGRTQVVEGGT